MFKSRVSVNSIVNNFQRSIFESMNIVFLDDDRITDADEDESQITDKETNDEHSNDSTDEIKTDTAQEDQDKLKANPGWADAISKVLKQKKAEGKKAIVLSRAKKIKDVKIKKPKLDFEIVGSEGDLKPQIEYEDEKKPNLGKKLMVVVAWNYLYFCRYSKISAVFIMNF